MHNGFDSLKPPADDKGKLRIAQPALAIEANPIKRFFKALGPGLITGASDDDPSGISTYAMAGAAFGFATLWTALVTFPLMAGVQFICAKIGMVSGKGIAGVLREHYPPKLLYAVVAILMIANTINAGADILAIAAGINLLIPLPVRALVGPIGLVILVVQVWGSYRLIVNIFKWLTLSLFAFIAAAILARPDWAEVLKTTFQPTLSSDPAFLAMLVAILGTTISPYLFFWQATQEVEEDRARGRRHLWQRRGATDEELKYAAWDVNAGMFFSTLVMYFIVLAAASTLHAAGSTEINSAAQAAEALRPLAGDAAYVLMALGLIGTGFLAVPILTASASYAVCETFGWKCSLDSKPGKAKEFYLILGASTIGGMLIDYIGINPIKALFWTAILNGLLAPPLLVVIMLVSNNKAVMGARANSTTLNVLGWAATAAMLAAAIGMVATWGKA